VTIRPIRRPYRPLVLACVAVLAVAACTDDDGSEPAPTDTSVPVPGDSSTGPTTTVDGRTLLELAGADGSLSTFVAAVEATGLGPTLGGAGPITLFVPTDAAFSSALATLGVSRDELFADQALLTQILTNHLVPGRLERTDLVGLNGRQLSTVGGTSVAVSVVGSDVKVGDATVVGDGIPSVNGVFHVIDAVLLPSVADEPVAGEGSVLDALEGREDLAAFSELAVAAGFEDLLLGPGAFTVFAPTDDAFEDALTTLGMGYEELLADTELLRTIVGYHIVDQRLALADLATLDPPDVATEAGPTIRIVLDGTTLTVNDATVLSGNIEATNGVVHLIDRVLLPTEP